MWKRHNTKKDVIDLLDAVGKYERATAYAFCLLQSETADNAEIRLGSDDAVAVWMDGKRVHHNPNDRPLILDQDVLEAYLKAGTNRCLVKVTQGVGNWAFSISIRALPVNRAVISGVVTDFAGKPVPDADVQMEQEDSQQESFFHQ